MLLKQVTFIFLLNHFRCSFSLFTSATHLFDEPSNELNPKKQERNKENRKESKSYKNKCKKNNSLGTLIYITIIIILYSLESLNSQKIIKPNFISSFNPLLFWFIFCLSKNDIFFSPPSLLHFVSWRLNVAETRNIHDNLCLVNCCCLIEPFQGSNESWIYFNLLLSFSFSNGSSCGLQKMSFPSVYSSVKMCSGKGRRWWKMKEWNGKKNHEKFCFLFSSQFSQYSSEMGTSLLTWLM